MKPKINEEKLVMQSVTACIHHPTVMHHEALKLGYDGKSVNLPSVGGITYNVKIGDDVNFFAGDHIEPGVSASNPNSGDNEATVALACVLNEVTMVSGKALGATGFVTGFHGGIDHTICYFEKSDLEKMIPGDAMLIKAYGTGMEIEDFPEITCQKISPLLYEKMGISSENGKLKVDVTKVISAEKVGAGIGSGDGNTGDIDVLTGNGLRYGDIVALKDIDTTFGRGYKKGAMTIGVIVHSNSIIPGHGPGVTSLFTCQKSKIVPIINENANIADYMGVK